MRTSQRIFKNTVVLLISSFLAQLLNFLVIVYLARVLAPEGFGKISFAMAFVSYFSLLSDLGLTLLGTRTVARERDRVNEYLGLILSMRLVLAIVSYGLLSLTVVLLEHQQQTRYLIFLYGFGIVANALLLDWAYQGVEEMEYISVGRVLSAGLYVSLVFFFIRGARAILYLPCIQVAANLVSALLFLYVFIKRHGKPKLENLVKRWKPLFFEALPLGVTLIMGKLISNSGMVLLGFLRSDAEVGYYSASYKIILPLIRVGSIFFNAVFPVISKYYITSHKSLQRLQSISARLITIIAIPMVISGILLARPIMIVFYGDTYIEGVVAFKLLIWVVALTYVNSIYGRGMMACNRQKEFMKIVLVQAAVNIGMNCVLVPFFGIIGAAISNISAEFLGFFFYYRGFNKVVRLPIHDKLLRPLIASAPMAALILYINYIELAEDISLMISVASGFVVYILTLMLIKGITKNDLRLVAGIFNK